MLPALVLALARSGLSVSEDNLGLFSTTLTSNVSPVPGTQATSVSWRKPVPRWALTAVLGQSDL